MSASAALPETTGPAHSVPCPHCGNQEDFTELLATEEFEKGATVDCDKCDRKSTVVELRQMTFVRLRAVPA